VESVPRVIPKKLVFDGEGRNVALRAAGAMTVPILASVISRFRGASALVPWMRP
jgi:hypothetical protein